MLRLMSLLSGPDLAMAFASKLINGTLHVGLFLSLNCDNRFEQLIFLSVYANLLLVAACYYFQPRMSCSATFIQFIIVIIIICKAVLRNVCSDFGTCNLKNDPLLSIQYVDRMSIHQLDLSHQHFLVDRIQGEATAHGSGMLLIIQ